MSDMDRDLRRVPLSEDELEQQLSRVGPLIVQQERFEAEMDPVFAMRLRAHLVDDEELAPHPTFARNLRARLLRRPGARPVEKPETISFPRRIGVSVLATAVLIAVLLFRTYHTTGSSTHSFTAPYPQRADLLFNLPSVPVAVHRLTATLSLVHPVSAIPYAGHLRLLARALPHEPSSEAAYRLALPSGVITRGRRLLHISARVRRVQADAVTWLVAQDGGVPAHGALHSLAISTRNGELIYHDRRNHVLPLARHPITQQRAVAIARQWLEQLGWPAYRMPLRSFHPVFHLAKVRAVEFGWPHVGPTATNEATMWITPDGSVIEAWVWPPIARHGVLAARSVTQAWDQVRRGTSPLAVEDISPSDKSGGVGSLLGTHIVSILTSAKEGTLYLVPAYRFNGTAQIAGSRRHVWYSLVPDMGR